MVGFSVIKNFLLWHIIDKRSGPADQGPTNGDAAIGRAKAWAVEILSCCNFDTNCFLRVVQRPILELTKIARNSTPAK